MKQHKARRYGDQHFGDHQILAKNLLHIDRVFGEGGAVGTLARGLLERGPRRRARPVTRVLRDLERVQPQRLAEHVKVAAAMSRLVAEREPPHGPERGIGQLCRPPALVEVEQAPLFVNGHHNRNVGHGYDEERERGRLDHKQHGEFEIKQLIHVLNAALLAMSGHLSQLQQRQIVARQNERKQNDCEKQRLEQEAMIAS